MPLPDRIVYSTEANDYSVAERIEFEEHLDTDFDAALMWLPMVGLEISGLGGMATDAGQLPEGADFQIRRPYTSEGKPVRSGRIIQTLAWITARRDDSKVGFATILDCELVEAGDAPKDGE